MKRTIAFLFAVLQSGFLFVNAQKVATIKDKYRNDFLIGTALNANQILEKVPTQKELIKKEFNAVTAENCMKSMLIHPEENRYDFELPDKLAVYAEENKMKLHGHTLIWHSQLSPFFKEIKDSAKMVAAMTAHIHTIGSHFKGKVYSWDVVNEALEEDGTLRKSVFYNVLGESYLPLAFKSAAAADPSADLYYNDYNMANKQKREGAIRMIKMIRASGAKIDGVGMQGHWGLDSPTLEEIETSIVEYAALGLKVSITELDIDVLPNAYGISGAEISQRAELRAELNPYTNGLPVEMQEKLAQRYKAIFDIFYKHRDKIDRVTFWGVNDGDSWKNDFPVRGRTNYCLLFDRNNQRKLAYNAILESDKK